MVLPHKIFIQRFLFNREIQYLECKSTNLSNFYVLIYAETFLNQVTNISYTVSMHNHTVTKLIEFIPNSKDLSGSIYIHNYAKSRRK
jgi:hypothetical protein